MHTPEYIHIIEEQALALGISVRHLSDEWAMELQYAGQYAYIVGYTFPLNDAAAYKIVRNKNLCSEILTDRSIANVPHDVIYSSNHLQKHGIHSGNRLHLEQLLGRYGFPVVLKKNNSTKGEGVFIATTWSQLEGLVAKISQTEAAFCLSPFREGIREFRTVVLDGVCMLSYEKGIPFITGDGESSVLELLTGYLKENSALKSSKGKLLDPGLASRFTDVLRAGERLALQWKHNRLRGSTYTVISNEEITGLATRAAFAVNARFVSVDIIYSEKHGYEVMEINGSVGMHFSFFPKDTSEYKLAASIYRAVLKKVFIGL